MSEPGITRREIIDCLKRRLAALDFIRALWLGGSDATGRTDEWSDVDLQLIVDDDRVEETFVAVRAALKTLAPVTHSWRLPEPTWHGHSQELLRIEDAGPFADVDLVVMKKSARDRFLEPERHGDAMVLFDRDGLVFPAPFDRAVHDEKLARRLAILRQQFPLFQVFVRKAVLRGMIAEAASLYQRVTIAALVELLRMRHAPERFDFGMRYLDRDLPPALRAKVEAWALPGSGEEMLLFQEKAGVLFAETLRALDAGEWRVGPGPRA